jgi:hypothetical protein
MYEVGRHGWFSRQTLPFAMARYWPTIRSFSSRIDRKTAKTDDSDRNSNSLDFIGKRFFGLLRKDQAVVDKLCIFPATYVTNWSQPDSKEPNSRAKQRFRGENSRQIRKTDNIDKYQTTVGRFS